MSGRAVVAPLFFPAEAEHDRLEARHAARKTPLSCGNTPGSNCVGRPAKAPGTRYDVGSYRRAIARACTAAKIPSWHPHQLRHNAATNLRKEFGIETARLILGHKNAAMTEIYAEADTGKALDVIAKVG